MKQSPWYAIRTVPGYQRMASPDERLPEKRRYESVIERNCRNEGFEVYMPSFFAETRHHRTNRIITKRFPLLVGYVFVDIPAMNFEDLRSVDGVMCILHGGRGTGPIKFQGEDIGQVMLGEMEMYYKYLAEREKQRKKRGDELRKGLRQIMPKGRAVRISMAEEAEKALDNLSTPVRGRVLGILNELNCLSAAPPVENFLKAV